MDHQRLGLLLQGPVHGVAFVEAGAQDQEHVELGIEDRRGCVPRAGIAEHAERKLVIFRQDALGAQGGCDRERPALGDRLERRRRVVVLDAGAGEDGEARAFAEERNRPLGVRQAERPYAAKEVDDGAVVRLAVRHHDVVGQREMHRPARLRQHRGQAVAEHVAEVLGAREGHGQARHRPHDRRVVEGGLACVLEFAEPFHGDRHFAAQHQDRRRVGPGRRHRGRHVAEARPADAKRCAEAAAGAGVAVGHVGGPALMRGDDRRELWKTGERRQKWIDQPARHHEQMIDALAQQRGQYKIGSSRHVRFPLSPLGRPLGAAAMVSHKATTVPPGRAFSRVASLRTSDPP